MTKVEVKKEGIFIPKALLDELEIEEVTVEVKKHRILIKPKSLTRKVRGIVKSRLTVKELDELYHSLEV